MAQVKRDTRSREDLGRLPALANLADHPAFTTLNISDLRMVAGLLERAGSLEYVDDAAIMTVSAGSARRLDQLQRGLRNLAGREHPAALAVSRELSRMRNEVQRVSGRDTRSRELILQSPHWAPFRDHVEYTKLSMVQLRAVDRLLTQNLNIENLTDNDLAEVAANKPEDLVLLGAAFRKLLGEDHAATIAIRRTVARQKDRSNLIRDLRPRELILEGSGWDKLRHNPAAHCLPIDQLRITDKFFAYCSARKLSHIEANHVSDFSKDIANQRRLHLLRNGLQALYGMHHPIVHTVEEARIAKSKAYYDNTARKVTIGQGTRPRKYSVTKQELPAAWQDVLTRLEKGERIQGRKAAAASVQSMRMQARYLLWAARQEGLPDQLSLEALRAYDRALDARGNRASSRSIGFRWLLMLGSYIGTDETVMQNMRNVAAYYVRLARQDLPLKESRLAGLPELGAIFELANDLLGQAATATHRTSRATLYADAGALALLSLIPFRNQDTVLLWGKHLTYGDGRYHLSKSITKTGATFTGKLHRILDPFLDALLLQGRPRAFLPQILEAAMKNEIPVFPKSNGAARSVVGLSRRWHDRIGTGSIINRTRIHTLLGDLGPEGVRAALALCAQQSYRTAEHYQAQSLARIETMRSQTLLNAAISLSDEEIEKRLEGL